MTDKEERIYICKTFKTDPCEICEGSGQIECVLCRKKPMFNKSISRSEAVERMAKVLCQWDTETNDCTECWNKNNKKACRCILTDEGYIARAEAALAALLGGKK